MYIIILSCKPPPFDSLVLDISVDCDVDTSDDVSTEEVD
jgi:hypothetical protein